MGKIVDGIYYDSKGKPMHRGIVKVDDKIYYAAKNGKIVKNKKKTVHHGMANGLVHHGTYYFDKDGVIDKSSYKKSHGKKAKSKKDKQKKRQTQIIVAAVIVVALIVFIPIGIKFFKDRKQTPVETTVDAVENTDITIPKYTDDQYLCTPAMEKFYKGSVSLQDVLNAKASGYAPFTFNYTLKNAAFATLELSEGNELADPVTYSLDVTAKSLSIDNLKTGTTYYYKVKSTNEDGNTSEATGSFRTAEGNRFITFPGVYNTRDIGGYNTLYGKKVKQGVLIRGSELDGLVEGKYFLTDVTATEPFGFRSEFDLRSSDIIITDFVSRLGSDVAHKFYDAPSYGQIFSKGKDYALRQIFADLANEDYYPMYLHCTYGVDRTGTIIFLLQGLLGVSEQDMRTEYELSGLYQRDTVKDDKINAIISGLAAIKGDNINEKIENYLIDTVGVTKEQIESIRSIFLENE